MVAFATLNGKAFYTISSLLEMVGIPYISITPGEKPVTSVRVIITTNREKRVIDFDKILCLEELGDDLNIAKERIIREVYCDQENMLIIGVDPGFRIGLAAYYMQQEVEGAVVNSVGEAISKIVRLVEHSNARKRIVKIGDGKPELAEVLARGISIRLGKSVEVELVDERGTSSLSRVKPNRRGLRDLRSARLIGLRQGRKFISN